MTKLGKQWLYMTVYKFECITHRFCIIAFDKRAQIMNY